MINYDKLIKGIANIISMKRVSKDKLNIRRKIIALRILIK